MLRAVILLISTVILFSPAGANQTPDDLQWQLLRQAYPNHLQVLALSQPDSRGLRTLIITEPPPDTLPKQNYQGIISSIFRGHFVGVHLKDNKIGVNGVVQDIVVTLKGYGGGSDNKDLRDDLAFLAETIWGTSYKALPLNLPITSRPAGWGAPRNISIRQSELNEWLVEGRLRFVPVELPSAASASIPELVGAGKTGSFMTSGQRGLVVLLIDRNRNFEEFRGEFRKFALDSDVIVGAVNILPNYLALVGRERESSIFEMPPLRFESARLLATSEEQDLAQSYERTNLFAGRLEEGIFRDHDWAPIYLSPVLIDTEIGSELNITDQMLKSWSMSGKVRYEGFNYNAPPAFPFSGKAILDEVGNKEPKIHETLFNWNTTGAFSIIKRDGPNHMGSVEIVASLNTGSLPIIYKDEHQPEFDDVFLPFEEEGYKYYRSLRDPLLAREVSYQVIFQATRDHRLRTELPIPSVQAKDKPALWRKIAELLEQSSDLSKISDDDITAYCGVASQRGEFNSSDDCTNAIALNQLSSLFFVSGSDQFKSLMIDNIMDRNKFKGGRTVDQKEIMDAIKAVGEGREEGVPEDLVPYVARFLAVSFVETTDLLGGVEPEDRVSAMKLFSADAANDPSSYIRTPTIVISRDLGHPGAIGGHNLDGAATHLQLSNAVKQGHVSIGEIGDQGAVLKLNPDDAPSAGLIGRTYAKGVASGKERAALQGELDRILTAKLPTRTVRSAMEFDLPADAARGMVVSEQFHGAAASDVGFEAVASQGAAATDVVAMAKQLSLSAIVFRRGDEIRIICVYCNGQYETVALSQVGLREGVVEAISQAPAGAERRIYFKDFDENEVQAFQATMAFGKGPPPPPIPPGTTASGAMPWRRAGGAGDGGGHNGSSGLSAAGPGGRRPLLLALKEGKREGDRGHALEVKGKGGGEIEVKELKQVSDYLQESANWNGARINPITDNAIGPKESRFELIVPRSSDPTDTPTFTFNVRWKENRLSSDDQQVVNSIADEKSNLVGSFQSGLHRLIDRLHALRTAQNAVTEVKVQFYYQIYDSVITLDLERILAGKPG